MLDWQFLLEVSLLSHSRRFFRISRCGVDTSSPRLENVMAKIIQFDPSRKVPPKHYTPEAMRGRLLQFKLPTTSVEARDSAATVTGHFDDLIGRITTDIKIS